MATPSTFVLVHSPLVGPKTWEGVAAQLADRDRVAVVPSMLGFADGGPPYWPSFVEGLVRSCERIDGPLTLVAHSGAGPLLPAAVGRLGGRVGSVVFADAALPPLAGSVELAPRWLREQLEALAVDGLLPPWSDWWGPDAMATLLPDERLRADLTSELPRLPLDYFEQTVDVPDGWSVGPHVRVPLVQRGVRGGGRRGRGARLEGGAPSRGATSTRSRARQTWRRNCCPSRGRLVVSRNALSPRARPVRRAREAGSRTTPTRRCARTRRPSSPSPPPARRRARRSAT